MHYSSSRHFFAALSRVRFAQYCLERFRGGRMRDRVLPALVLAALILSALYGTLFSAPSGPSIPTIVTVESEETLGEIAEKLEAAHIIRDASVFQIVARAVGYNRLVRSGSYFFHEGEWLMGVISRLRNGEYGLEPVRITFIEGTSVDKIAATLDSKLSPFDKEGFLALARPLEGYLYPDTYLFYPGQGPETVVKIMFDNFKEEIKSVEKDVEAFEESREDLVIMASILVGEARTKEDRKLVAGILWKRIEKGMPLQVDAPFGYVLQKKLTNLTSDDTDIESPYNTYLNKGLPPTPIGNPGVGAILAAATPTTSAFWYYMSDKEGNMHFSVTYDEHMDNIARYLK